MSRGVFRQGRLRRCVNWDRFGERRRVRTDGRPVLRHGGRSLRGPLICGSCLGMRGVEVVTGA